ncbi:unnamed protein product [Adineta steineri]|uniref:G-protein coupled receptors family 1 profile domain-containing protein n=1 Tax=Adineta steineri TaxID=433720 RepID=A0A818UJL4_9BILA|nr:unnamed protein product [Adineta steineri]CAF3699353.1 unnamed protein product [Adineta steineri]
MSINETNTNGTSDSSNDAAQLLLRLSIWSLRIVCPFIIIFCPISNWACIKIFQSRIYARSSSKWYFIFIAIFDTIYVVVTASLLLLLTLEIYILNMHVLSCKIIIFLNYLSCQISAGLLACLSIDRLVATSCISMYRQNCTTNLSKNVCFAVIIIFSIVNSHYLFGYTIGPKGGCSPRHYNWYDKNYSRLNIVYLLSYSIIPFTIITICNIFIVISVCQNKTNMKKKYDMKKSILPSNNQHKHTVTGKCSAQMSDKPTKVFVSINDNKKMTNLLNSNSDWQSDQIDPLSEKLLLTGDQSVNSSETTTTVLEHGQLSLTLKHENSISTRCISSSPSNSQKMCVQFQITISLLAISICFILCTLPNCITTIMIQAYANDDQKRKLWQAMNYLSIIPLLITHSVNLIFYYLSSNMFRERFKEYYLKK